MVFVFFIVFHGVFVQRVLDGVLLGVVEQKFPHERGSLVLTYTLREKEF
jgi:hypothetical protein